ncbi:aspartate/glutamate racemase family protein [Nocardia farcinica]|uniref:Glutamate racemase n=1 Tax=Nocardia farcinica TaxID=37329 RepID=A0A0H5P3R9_NOCFR|nr:MULTISPECIES: aspartate/glutamate racemase family protein [Nocardia]AXK87652.1 glutamate racemase [Nocardia farcinica]MBA4856755.1 aspartate/glutamate racemase family protein [Nocardia farcinica]MBC9818899.1 aspartate/glutamate racemase family protein [Nocardia farcinica]MBF6072018.1 aspartate/glutamate racemase family protein [Nocardia farcinica]MBF6141533.1 aspartate/glutamate racemase family protein [Nocardia farcinica]
MIVALIDSGLGLLPTAAWLRKLRPDVDLLLQLDPDGAPWGPKPEQWTIERVVAAARTSIAAGAEVIVLPCNTASVTALEQVRAEVGPEVPVIGTVPAIKPAAAACRRVAVWATAATTASRYQAELIEKFGGDAEVVGVACHGLADAIDRGDLTAATDAIARAAAQTPAGTEGVVLGCTHYPLVVDAIVAALPAGVRLFDSAQAVAAQTIRKMEGLGRPTTGEGVVRVLNSGRPGTLPPSAAAYEPGRILGAQP